MKSDVIMGIVLTALLIGMLALAFEVDVAAAEPPQFVDSGQSLGSADSDGVALGDLDGDGDLDAFVANVFYPNRVWVNNGDGTFTAGQGLGSANSDGVALGDLDGDGDLDAFVANYPGANRVWVNNGDGTFTAGQGLGSAHSHDVELGDLDGDGDLDAFVANGYYQANEVWVNVTPQPAPPSPPPVGGIWVPVDKLGLLTPYVALALTVIVATVATAHLIKHKKKQ